MIALCARLSCIGILALFTSAYAEHVPESDSSAARAQWEKHKSKCITPVARSFIIHNKAEIFIAEFDPSESIVYEEGGLTALRYRIALYRTQQEFEELKSKQRPAAFVTEYDMVNKEWKGVEPNWLVVVLNFKNAPMSRIAERYAECTGKMVAVEDEITERITIIHTPCSREEAAKLIETALSEIGYAMVPINHKTVRIVRRDKNT